MVAVINSPWAEFCRRFSLLFATRILIIINHRFPTKILCMIYVTIIMKDYIMMYLCAHIWFNDVKPRRILEINVWQKKSRDSRGFRGRFSSHEIESPWLDLVRILHIRLRMQKTGLRSRRPAPIKTRGNANTLLRKMENSTDALCPRRHPGHREPGSGPLHRPRFECEAREGAGVNSCIHR